MESYDSRHSRHSVTSGIASQLQLENAPLRLDSQCKYGLLARGDGNIFMRFPDPTYRCALPRPGHHWHWHVAMPATRRTFGDLVIMVLNSVF